MANKNCSVEVTFKFLNTPTIFVVGRFETARKAEQWISNDLVPTGNVKGIKIAPRILSIRDSACRSPNYQPGKALVLLDSMRLSVLRRYKPLQTLSTLLDDLDYQD